MRVEFFDRTAEVCKQLTAQYGVGIYNFANGKIFLDGELWSAILSEVTDLGVLTHVWTDFDEAERQVYGAQIAIAGADVIEYRISPTEAIGIRSFDGSKDERLALLRTEVIRIIGKGIEPHEFKRPGDVAAWMTDQAMRVLKVQLRRHEFVRRTYLEVKSRETWVDWKRRRQQEGRAWDAPFFLSSVYGDLIALGMLQKDLKRLDPKGYKALHGWCDHHGRDPGDFISSSMIKPDKLIAECGGKAPTYAEARAAMIAGGGEGLKKRKIYNALKRRLSEVRNKLRDK